MHGEGWVTGAPRSGRSGTLRDRSAPLEASREPAPVLPAVPPAAVPPAPEESECGPHSRLTWSSFMALGIAESMSQRVRVEGERESEQWRRAARDEAMGAARLGDLLDELAGSRVELDSEESDGGGERRDA